MSSLDWHCCDWGESEERETPSGPVLLLRLEPQP
jgi:hypothetical protein